MQRQTFLLLLLNIMQNNLEIRENGGILNSAQKRQLFMCGPTRQAGKKQTLSPAGRICCTDTPNF